MRKKLLNLATLILIPRDEIKNDTLSTNNAYKIRYLQILFTAEAFSTREFGDFVT